MRRRAIFLSIGALLLALYVIVMMWPYMAATLVRGSAVTLRAARTALAIELERLLPGTEISLTLDTNSSL